MSRTLSDTDASRCFERQIRILARDIERRASGHGLPSCDWFVLDELERSNTISLRDLALASAVSLPAASKAIKRFAADGLVDVHRVPGDKRLSAISITDAGVQFLMKKRARKEPSSGYHEVMAEEDLRALARSLAALASNVRQLRDTVQGEHSSQQ